jgi:hypothetical protein
MNLARRNHYLGAMGIDIWVPRRTATRASEAALQPARSEETAALQPDTVEPKATRRPWLGKRDSYMACGSAIAGRVVLGPGAGSTLLLCGKPGEAATALAADIARSLGSEPVWSWLAQDEAAPGVPLEQAIEERLFTRVLVFGRDLFAPAADPAVQVIGSARLIRVESIPVLVQSGAARRALWLALNEY